MDFDDFGVLVQKSVLGSVTCSVERSELSLGLSFCYCEICSGVIALGLGSAIGVAIVYGLLKFFFYWILVLVSLPFVILTLGLFLVVINAGLLWITDKLLDGFEIDGLFSTLIASVLISIVDIVLRWVLPWV